MTIEGVYPDPALFGHDPWWLVLGKALAIFVFLVLTPLVCDPGRTQGHGVDADARRPEPGRARGECCRASPTASSSR